MEQQEMMFNVEFSFSEERELVSLAELERCVTEFLELYGEEPIVGKEFRAIIGEGDGEIRFSRLLAAVHHEDDAQGFFSSVRRLEKLTNIKVPQSERELMQQVLDQYPVRLSRHAIRQIRLSPAVAYQFMPFSDELDQEGLFHTWVGQFHRGYFLTVPNVTNLRLNSKHEIRNKSKIQMFKIQNKKNLERRFFLCFHHLKFGHLNLFRISIFSVF